MCLSNPGYPPMQVVVENSPVGVIVSIPSFLPKTLISKHDYKRIDEKNQTQPHKKFTIFYTNERRVMF